MPIVLNNAKPGLLEYEKYFVEWGREIGYVRIVPVRAAQDLLVLHDTLWRYKFVLTEAGELLLGCCLKKYDPKNVSHPALASYATLVQRDVVCAGYFEYFLGKIHIINCSGHYLPDFECLRLVQKKLTALGVMSTKSKQLGFWHWLIKARG